MKTQRPPWDEYFLEGAEWAALRADCTRRSVGAILVKEDRTVVSTGYNGAEPGGPSCLKGECPRGLKTREELPGYADPGATSYDIGAGACVAIHAEQNCLLRASWSEQLGSTLYVNCEPCPGCWRMIKASPLARVVWPGGDWFRGEPVESRT